MTDSTYIPLKLILAASFFMFVLGFFMSTALEPYMAPLASNNDFNYQELSDVKRMVIRALMSGLLFVIFAVAGITENARHKKRLEKRIK